MRTPTCIFLALCTLLSGCNSYNKVTLTVSEAGGDPVSGASVQASPMYFFNPSDKNYIVVGPYDIVDPFPAEGDRGTTDEIGEVELQIVLDSPLRLTVFSENFAPWKGEIAITEHGVAQVRRTGSVTALQVNSN
ncbi:MAG: hypothetical protein H8E91_07755 [Planctomycetes bacterium]|nr:hypothetical protein [Planctomycetota bacterium]